MSITTDPSGAIVFPGRVQRLLDRANKLGLTVDYRGNDHGVHAWTIGSRPESWSSHAVFLYWTPGKRDGRVRALLYRTVRPFRNRQRSKPISLRDASQWLDIIAI